MARGGKRDNAGRKKGIANHLTQTIQEMALPHAERAFNVLVSLMASDNEKIRQDSANSILDRAFGKAKQQVDVEAKVTLAQLVAGALEDEHRSSD